MMTKRVNKAPLQELQRRVKRAMKKIMAVIDAGTGVSKDEPKITVSMDTGAGGDSGGDSYKTKLAELANKMSSLNYLNLESAPGQTVLEQNLPKVLSNPTISDHIR
ncbi:unnamed protein product [Orchesella dallaii]|uniref:Uncharacterized protein n=1 Tax=Orchesella dallaii TaxID=48710 RepID=A0ABP1QST0_9HEXA